MIEKWKVLYCNSNYEISNLGNIRNKKGQIIKQQNKKGYMQIGLRNGKEKKWYITHRLIAEAFISDKTTFKSMPYEDRTKISLDDLQINHKDENTLNNNVDNLEWCTCSYNINYGNRNKKMSKKISKKIIQYDLDNNLIKEWISMLEIQRELGIWHSRIGKCCRGITKSVNGYIWKYEGE